MDHIAAQFGLPQGDAGLSVAMLMHLAHKADYAAVMDCVPVWKGMRLLEIGSALGLQMLPWVDAGARCIGVDHSPDMVRCARHSVANAEFICADVCHGNLPSCDAVIAVNSLQWWRHPQMAFCFLHDALPPNGPLVIGIAAPLAPGHLPDVGQRHYSTAEIADMMVRGGFTDIVTEAAIVAGRVYIVARGVA